MWPRRAAEVWAGGTHTMRPLPDPGEGQFRGQGRSSASASRRRGSPDGGSDVAHLPASHPRIVPRPRPRCASPRLRMPPLPTPRSTPSSLGAVGRGLIGNEGHHDAKLPEHPEVWPEQRVDGLALDAADQKQHRALLCP